jgi:8-oxo-dGTP pyrophosphatase MutT (NUDIX family)
VKHWSEDKYLGAEWLKTGWKGFNIGGIEDNESAKDAGLREIVEETGY